VKIRNNGRRQESGDKKSGEQMAEERQNGDSKEKENFKLYAIYDLYSL
jgi:hypothetical protein